jgi:hypothetical protein
VEGTILCKDCISSSNSLHTPIALESGFTVFLLSLTCSNSRVGYICINIPCKQPSFGVKNRALGVNNRVLSVNNRALGANNHCVSYGVVSFVIAFCSVRSVGQILPLHRTIYVPVTIWRTIEHLIVVPCAIGSWRARICRPSRSSPRWRRSQPRRT